MSRGASNQIFMQAWLLRQVVQAETPGDDVRLAVEVRAVGTESAGTGSAGKEPVGMDLVGTEPAGKRPVEAGHWARRGVAHYNNTWVDQPAGLGRAHYHWVATSTVVLAAQFLPN